MHPEKIVSHAPRLSALRNPSIKAIPTLWRGRHYRSRLEARWAVFFDTMGLELVYEPEGFELSDGTRYLPDFYLPQVKWFAEVKPVFSATSDNKAFRFSQLTGLSSLILDHSPALRSYTGLQRLEGATEPSNVEFSLDVWTFRKAFAEGRLWSDPDYIGMQLSDDDLGMAFSPRYQSGVLAANTARFE